MRLPAAFLVAALVACSGCQTATDPSPNTVTLKFEPRPGDMLVALGARQRFAVRSDEGTPVRADYSVDGNAVYSGNTFSWLVESLGLHRIQAEVDLGTHTRTAVWSVEVREVDLEFVPTVTQIQSAPGALWGTLALRWHRPAVPELHIPIASYRIYYSHLPFVDLDAAHLKLRTVADDAESSEQEVLLSDLDPERDCYLVCVSVNQLGRSSTSSHLVVGRARGAGSLDLPPPRELTVAVPDEFESLRLSWSPPPLEAGVVLDHYEVYWSEATFGPDQLATVSARNFTALTGRMSVLFDGLASDTIYYFRVRGFATTGRASAASSIVSARTRITAIEFRLSGSVREIDLVGWQLRPFGGVSLVAEKDSTQSDANGDWLLDTRTQGQLTLVAHTGGAHYPAHVPILGSEELRFDFLMLPVGFVQITGELPSLSGPMSRMEFLHRMTGTRQGSSSQPGTFHRWNEYPIQIERPTIVLEHDGESIDYALAFERGVAAWNLTTGAQLLRLVDDRPAQGVYVTLDLAPSSGLLGSTEFVQPPLSWFNEADPILLRVRLREFNSQAVADRIALHELGHCLGLLHSPSRDHVMQLAAPALPIHADEAMLVRLLSILPQSTPLSWYVETP